MLLLEVQICEPLVVEIQLADDSVRVVSGALQPTPDTDCCHCPTLSFEDVPVDGGMYSGTSSN